MKIALIIVTCLAVAAAAVLGVVAGKTCAAKTTAEEERDALAEQVEELHSEYAARAKAFVELMAVAPGPQKDEETGELRSILSTKRVYEVREHVGIEIVELYFASYRLL